MRFDKPRLHPALILAALCLLPPAAAPAKPARSREADARPLYVSIIDQLPAPSESPVFNGLDERRRGPIFNDALQSAVHDGELRPFHLLNTNLDLPSTVADEPKAPAGATVVRVYLTQWSLTPLGGVADTEVLCRFSVYVLRDGKVTRKLGPFFAHRRYEEEIATTPERRWKQFQAAARHAIEDLAAALPPD